MGLPSGKLKQIDKELSSLLRSFVIGGGGVDLAYVWTTKQNEKRKSEKENFQESCLDFDRKD